MQKHFSCWSGAAIGTAIALALGSCAYDPNYMAGGAYSASYEGGGQEGGYGYGEGYGYGGSGFSTSVFVSTGDPRWGYDPSCYCYYDYNRRCYYDPYLYGYYPLGYRPMIVLGVPHPYGYSRSYCPPPSRVMNITLSNYHNRESAYRSSSYAWAHQVRQQVPSHQGQPKPASYQRNTPPPYSGNRNQAQPPVAYPQPRRSNTSGNPSANPASRRPASQPTNYNPSSRPATQGGAGQVADPQRGRSGNPGGARVPSGGAVPQRQAPSAAPQRQAPAAAPTKGRSDGRGEKGRGDKEGGGR